jgi:hypothetical protein
VLLWLRCSRRTGEYWIVSFLSSEKRHPCMIMMISFAPPLFQLAASTTGRCLGYSLLAKFTSGLVIWLCLRFGCLGIGILFHLGFWPVKISSWLMLAMLETHLQYG